MQQCVGVPGTEKCYSLDKSYALVDLKSYAFDTWQGGEDDGS